MSDSSQRTLETFETQLSASWSQGGWAFHGFKQWYGDMTEKILEASGEGLVLTITAPHCKTKQLRITRGDIRSNYDPPRIQVGGHGTGFHSAQVTYESICRIDLECELAASRPLQPTSGVAAPADSK
jgi:hypothetical protein